MVSPTSPAIMTTSFLKFSSLRPLTQPTLPCWSMWMSEIAKTLVRFLGNVESILNLSMARVPGLRLTWVSVMGTLGSREAAARQSSRASSHCPRPLQYTQYASSTFPRPSTVTRKTKKETHGRFDVRVVGLRPGNSSTHLHRRPSSRPCTTWARASAQSARPAERGATSQAWPYRRSCSRRASLCGGGSPRPPGPRCTLPPRRRSRFF